MRRTDRNPRRDDGRRLPSMATIRHHHSLIMKGFSGLRRRECDMKQSYTSASLLTRSQAHLRGAGESYVRHLRFAANVAALMIAAGLACLLHALVPGLFPDKASRAVGRLHAAFENRAEAEARLETREDAGGLLTLLILSILTALFPWIGNADIAIS